MKKLLVWNWCYMVEPISLGPWSEIEMLALMVTHPITSGGGLRQALGKIFHTETELATTNSCSKKFCVWFLTGLGQSMEHTGLQLIPLIVLPFLYLIQTPRVSQDRCMLRLPRLLHGLPCSWRWFLLILESCLLWVIPYWCFSFLKLKSEALFLFESKSGSVLGNCGIFKNVEFRWPWI